METMKYQWKRVFPQLVIKPIMSWNVEMYYTWKQQKQLHTDVTTYLRTVSKLFIDN